MTAQELKLRALIQAAECALEAASRDRLMASRPGARLAAAVADLFEVAAMFDTAEEIAWNANIPEHESLLPELILTEEDRAPNWIGKAVRRWRDRDASKGIAA
jgi:hypothetical protein